jgi:hypothetical protein
VPPALDAILNVLAVVEAGPAPAVPPQPQNDAYTVVSGGTLRVPAPQGLLGNDAPLKGGVFRGPGGDQLQVMPITTGANATVHQLQVGQDGSMVLHAAEGTTGDYTFTHTALDEHNNAVDATVTITVVAPERPAPVVPPETRPEPANDAYTVPSGGTLQVDAQNGLLINDGVFYDGAVRGPDGHPLQVRDGITAIYQPQNGTRAIRDDGSLVYTPNKGFSGVDSFRYEMTDGFNVEEATVTITVTPPELRPVPEPVPFREGHPISDSLAGPSHPIIDGTLLFA